MVTLKAIRAAYPAIARVAVRTPLLALKEGPRNVFVKCENLQRGGAFKLRGAYHNIRSHLAAARRHGVVGCSSGNHAQAMALAARMLGVDATIVMLDQSMPHKVEGTRRYGGRVVFGGRTSTAIFERMQRIAERQKRAIVHPFDAPETIAGAGTIGLEIHSQMRDVRAVVVPIGGGGLISGVATAIKGLNPRIRVYGVEPRGAAKMFRSRRAGRLVTLPKTDTIADGLKPVRGGVNTFEHIERHVDELVLVSDREILDTCRYLMAREKLVVEPSGAASVAAIRFGRVPVRGPTVAVISGGNVDFKAVLTG